MTKYFGAKWNPCLLTRKKLSISLSRICMIFDIGEAPLVPTEVLKERLALTELRGHGKEMRPVLASYPLEGHRSNRIRL